VDAQILIFRLQGYDFALDPAAFPPPFALDGAVLDPTPLDRALWHYQFQQDPPKQGLLLHVGLMLGLEPFALHEEGLLFQQMLPGYGPLGLYLENYIQVLSKAVLAGKLREAGELSRLPPKMPTTAIRYYYKHRGRALLLLEPERLLTSYQIGEKGSIFDFAPRLNELAGLAV